MQEYPGLTSSHLSLVSVQGDVSARMSAMPLVSVVLPGGSLQSWQALAVSGPVTFLNSFISEGGSGLPPAEPHHHPDEICRDSRHSMHMLQG